MRFGVKGLGFAVVVTLAFVGCKKTHNKRQLNDTGPAPVSGMSKVAEAVCDKLMSCADTQGRLFSSREGCIQFVKYDFANCSEAATDSAAVTACVAALNASECSQDAVEGVLYSDVCDIFVDTSDAAHEGQSCQTESCDELTYCKDSATAGVCAVCAALPGVSESCADSYACADSNACAWDATATDYICKAPGAQDDPCTWDSLCADGLYCDNNSSSCQLLKANDTACDWGEQCVSGICDYNTSQCSGPLANGGYCNFDTDCQSGYCSVSSYQCADKAVVDSDCGDNADCLSDFCDPDTYKCANKLPIDSVCTSSDACEGSNRACLDGKCSELRMPDEACTYDEDCVRDAYCNADSKCALKNACMIVQVNDNCEYASCAAGAFCDYRQYPATCAAFHAIDEQCTYDVECVSSAYCDTSGVTSVCKARKAASQDCLDSTECVEGAYCDTWTVTAPTGQCQTLKDNGQPCTYDMECQSDNCDSTDSGQCFDPAVCTMPAG